MGFTEAVFSSFAIGIDSVTYLSMPSTILTHETCCLEMEMELELQHCVVSHDSKLSMFKTGPILVLLRIHPLTRVPFSLRGSVYSRHNCCICRPSSVSRVQKNCSRSTSFRPASEHNLDNFWSSDSCSNFRSYSFPHFPNSEVLQLSPEPNTLGYFVAYICYCSVDTELISRNHCVEKQLDGFIATIEVY